MNPSIIHLRVSRSLIILVGLIWPLGLMFGLGFLSNYTFWAAACFSVWWLSLLVRFGLLAWQHVYLSDHGIRLKNYTGDYSFAWNSLHAIEFVAEPAEPRFMDRDLSYLWATFAVRFSDAQHSIIVHTRFSEHDRTLLKTKLAHYRQQHAIPTKTLESIYYPAIYPERLSLGQKMLRLHQPPLTKLPATLCRLGLLLLIVTLGYLAFSKLPFVLGLAAFAFYQVFKLSLALLPNAIKQPEVLLHPQDQQLYVPKLVNTMIFGRGLGFYALIFVSVSLYYLLLLAD